MNTKRNLLYKRLFALSLTGMLLSSPASVLASQNQSPEAGNEQTRAVSPQNTVLLNHINGSIRNGSSLVINAITGGNPGNNLGTVIPQMQAAVDELEAAADALADTAVDLGVAIEELDAEIDALTLVVADIPTNTELTAAVLVGTDAVIAELQGSGTSNDLTTLTNQLTTQGVGPLATSAQVGTLVNTGGVATIGGILGDPANVSISSQLGTINGNVNDIETAVNTVNTNLGDPVNGSVASNVGDLTAVSGLYAQTSAIQGAGGATNSLTTLNTKLGTPATTVSGDIALLGVTNVGAVASTGLYNLVGGANSGGTGVETGVFARIGAPVNTIGTATIAGILGNPNAAIVPAVSIVNILADIEGAGFVSADDSLKAISVNLGNPVNGSVASNVGDLTAVSGLYAQTSAIQGAGGAANSLTTLNTAVGLLATSAALGLVATNVDDIEAAVGTPVNTIGTATLAGILGNPNAAIVPATSIVNILADIEGAGFLSASDSLKAISVNLGDPVNGSVASNVGDLTAVSGLYAQTSAIQGAGGAANSLTTLNTAVGLLATSNQAVDIQGRIGDPLVAGLTSTLALVLGDPTASTTKASISAAIGAPAAASVSADIALLGVIGNGTTTATGLYAQDYAIKGTNATGTVIVGDDALYTAATNNLTALSQGLSAIKGSGFAAANDSLEKASAKLDLINTAVVTSIPTLIDALPTGVELQNALDNSTEEIQGTGGSANTLTTIAAAQAAQGAGPFSTVAQVNNLGTSSDTSGLYALLTTIVGTLTTDPVLSVTFAKSSLALSTTVTVSAGPANPGTYNGNLVTALASATTATTFATQSQTNTATAITNINTAISNFNDLITAWGAGPTTITSAYSEAQISGALLQLKNALIGLQSAQASV